MATENCVYTWLDCDPGIDDAIAIILAHFSPSVKLLGISTVAGNCTLDKATVNALNVLNIAGQIKPCNETLHSTSSPLSLKDCTKFGLTVPVVNN